jgi:hypothetical protein
MTEGRQAGQRRSAERESHSWGGCEDTRTPSTTVCLRRLKYSLLRCTTHVPFVLFLLAIVLSVLRYTDSDYSFGIFT